MRPIFTQFVGRFARRAPEAQAAVVVEHAPEPEPEPVVVEYNRATRPPVNPSRRGRIETFLDFFDSKLRDFRDTKILLFLIKGDERFWVNLGPPSIIVVDKEVMKIELVAPDFMAPENVLADCLVVVSKYNRIVGGGPEGATRLVSGPQQLMVGDTLKSTITLDVHGA